VLIIIQKTDAKLYIT